MHVLVLLCVASPFTHLSHLLPLTHLFLTPLSLCKATKEPFSEMKEHKKLIEKGKPEDVPAGYRYRTVSGRSRVRERILNTHALIVLVFSFFNLKPPSMHSHILPSCRSLCQHSRYQVCSISMEIKLGYISRLTLRNFG